MRVFPPGDSPIICKSDNSKLIFQIPHSSSPIPISSKPSIFSLFLSLSFFFFPLTKFRLVNAGFKVGVVGQLETASLKDTHGPFQCDVTNLYTKSTLISGEICSSEDTYSCGYLLCLNEEAINTSGSQPSSSASATPQSSDSQSQKKVLISLAVSRAFTFAF